MADDEQVTDEQAAALRAAAEAEGDTVDASTLPDGLRPEPEPETEEVEIGGVRTVLPKEAAEALRSQMSSYEQQLEEARHTRPSEPPSPTPEPQPEDNWEDLWFSDPAKAVERLKTDIRTELTGEYQRERALEKWWGDFDRENPQLADKRWLTQAVMNEEWDEIKDLSPTAGRRKLAELTKERIMGLAPQTPRQPDDTATLEGGGSGPDLRVVNAGSDTPQTLSAAIRAKAAQRVQKKGE